VSLTALAVAIDEVARHVAPSSFSNLACCTLAVAAQLLRKQDRPVSAAHARERAKFASLRQWSSDYATPIPVRTLDESLRLIASDKRVDASARSLAERVLAGRIGDEIEFARTARRVAPKRATSGFVVDRIATGLDFGVAPDAENAVWLVLHAAGLPWDDPAANDPVAELVVQGVMDALLRVSTREGELQPLQAFLGVPPVSGTVDRSQWALDVDPRTLWAMRPARRLRDSAISFLSHLMASRGSLDPGKDFGVVAARVACGAIAQFEPTQQTLGDLSWVAWIAPEAEVAGSLEAHKWLIEVEANRDSPEELARAGRQALACARVVKRSPLAPAASAPSESADEGAVSEGGTVHRQYTKAMLRVWSLQAKSRCQLTLDEITRLGRMGRKTAVSALRALRELGIIQKKSDRTIVVRPLESLGASTKSELK
jgi:hypothetical protein